MPFELFSKIQMINENYDTVEKFFGVVCIGSILTIVKGVAAYYALMTSYKIEIAFMSKAEQWKYDLTHKVTFFVTIFLNNLVYGYMAQDEEVCSGAMSIGEFAIVCIIFQSVLLVLCWFWRTLKEIPQKVHVFRTILYVTRGWRDNIKALIYRISQYFLAVRKFIGEKFSGLLKLKVIVAVSNFMKSWRTAWKATKAEKNQKIKTYSSWEYVRQGIAISVLVLSVSMTCDIVNGQEFSYKSLFLTSCLMSIFSYAVTNLLAKRKSIPGRAQVYITDGMKEKYVYFRYNEKLYICGDAQDIGNCKEYYLIDFEELQKGTLYPIQSGKVYTRNDLDKVL